MTRYIVVVEPDKVESVLKSLRALGIAPIKIAINYISIDIPEDLVERVRELPHVVSVIREQTYTIRIPVEAKLARFIEMGGPLNPAAMAWSLAQGLGKDRWPTGESRKVLGADTAERMGITGRGVKVAVLDTGFDVTIQKPTVDYMDSTLEGDPTPIDVQGHGVHVLTSIAGDIYPTPWGNLQGVATGAEIGSIKTLGYLIGTARTIDVIEAVVNAYSWGAKIVNMSLGSDIPPGETHDVTNCPLCSLITMLSNRGVIFVVAAGNSGYGYASCPGASPGAITVAAVDKRLNVADFTSRGHRLYIDLRKPNVAAPGVNIGSSTTGLIAVMEWYDASFRAAYLSGTSMSTPHISGLVALWVEYAKKKGYDLDRSTVMDIVSRYGGGWREDKGYGVPRFEWIVDYLR